MEHHQKGMSRKWERHYMETRSTIGSALILFGATFLLALSYLWPQIYNPSVFDSRLAYHLIMDIEDYWTCNKDYQNFVIDEPAVNEAMLQIFMFNVSNAPQVIQQGYKPYINEVGPYAYRKKTYKYDIYFDPKDTTKVSFKEYTLLVQITEARHCTTMFHRMDRSDSASTDPCVNGACECKDHDETVTIINPLFMKMIWEDKAQNILAYFSVDVYSNIKDLLETDFVDATKSHLIPKAINEIYQFRSQMQVHNIFIDMYSNLTSQGFTNAQIAVMHSDYPHGQLKFRGVLEKLNSYLLYTGDFLFHVEWFIRQL